MRSSLSCWQNCRHTDSMGSSAVTILISGRYTDFMIANRLVLFPEPVGPVTRIVPAAERISCCSRSVTGAAIFSAVTESGAPRGSRIRMPAVDRLQVDVGRAAVDGDPQQLSHDLVRARRHLRAIEPLEGPGDVSRRQQFICAKARNVPEELKGAFGVGAATASRLPPSSAI